MPIRSFPFERLVEELRPKRTPGYHPFFQVLFNYLEVPRQATEIPGVRIEDFEVGLDTALVDLSVHVERTDAGTTCYFTYSSDLFDHARLAGGLRLRGFARGRGLPSGATALDAGAAGGSRRYGRTRMTCCRSSSRCRRKKLNGPLR